MEDKIQTIQTTKSLASLKKEMIHRAEINLYPVFGIPVDVMRSTVNDIQSLSVDEWANAFIKAGKIWSEEALAKSGNDLESAIKYHGIAQRLYNMGRWPAVLSESRKKSYRLERESFKVIQKLRNVNLERVENTYNEFTSVGYLVKPSALVGSTFPLVISIGGLDGWKEARINQLMPLVEQGIAVLSLDMPGTGQSGVKMGSDAEETLFDIIEKVLNYEAIDKTRVVMYGGSFGGYWTTLLAARNRLKLKGVVNQSGPYSHTFKAEQLSSVFDGNEYLYDSLPALSNLIEGVKNREDLLKEIGSHAIDKLISGPLNINCPMLIVGGKNDSLVPLEDLSTVLFSNGMIKEAWINPNGIHMGRERGNSSFWDDKKIYTDVIFPWINAHI